MTRPAPSFFKCLPSGSHFPPPVRPAARRCMATLSGHTVSVDPRIFAGSPHFLDKGNFDRLCEWQSGLWTRLQAEVQNRPELLEVRQKWDRSGLDMTHLVSQAAKDASLTLAFNYGSLLLNNSYFLEGLSGDDPKPVPSTYRDLEERVEAYAEGMVGGGWLWLARAGDNHDDIDLIPTFGAGTLLITNRAQRGREVVPAFMAPSSPTAEADPRPSAEPSDNSSPPSPPSKAATPKAESTQLSSAEWFRNPSTATRINSRRKVGEWPIPLACLNLFEHAYLGDKYGVWGKRQYARDWFRSLDWDKVQKRSAQVA